MVLLGSNDHRLDTRISQKRSGSAKAPPPPWTAKGAISATGAPLDPNQSVPLRRSAEGAPAQSPLRSRQRGGTARRIYKDDEDQKMFDMSRGAAATTTAIVV